MRALTTSLFLVGLTAASGWASNNCQIIDDFSSGTIRSALRDPGTTDRQTQIGTMLGGVRGTSFEIVPNGNSFFQPAELDIDNPPDTGVPLVVTTGLRTGWRLDMEYGVDTSFTFKPLNYLATDCDRFRVTFNSASRTLNFNIVAFYTALGHNALDGINLDPSPFTSPFCVDFPFSNFTPGIPGDTPDFTQKPILLLDFVFQSGSAIGGNEFAITKIETLDSATAAEHACAIVAPPVGS